MSVLRIVLVNCVCVCLGVGGVGIFPPMFELMQSLAYSGNLSSAGGNFREVQQSDPHKVCSHQMYPAPHHPHATCKECFCVWSVSSR